MHVNIRMHMYIHRAEWDRQQAAELLQELEQKKLEMELDHEDLRYCCVTAV